MPTVPAAILNEVGKSRPEVRKIHKFRCAGLNIDLTNILVFLADGFWYNKGDYAGWEQMIQPSP